MTSELVCHKLVVMSRVTGDVINYHNDSIYLPGHLFTSVGSREDPFLREGAYLGQGAYFFFEKQRNVQNKILIFICDGTITETVTITNIQ